MGQEASEVLEEILDSGRVDFEFIRYIPGVISKSGHFDISVLGTLQG
jgi:hypothetical protein